MTDTTWLTPAAHQKLIAELERLKTDGRRQIEIRLAEARSHGDLRENGDYDAAKNDQGLMEARIRQLQALIDTAEVREAADDGVVSIGSIVTVVDEDGDEMEYFVANRANKVPGYILTSPESPLGEALLEKRVGDGVSYEANGRIFTVEIRGVRPFRD
ncbi:MAG TPA: transcription elongation factor GreA [Acidimicrobiia bacterium]|nr:transcription elongation factor GreA [Acidimicrobiia bacterium]